MSSPRDSRTETLVNFIENADQSGPRTGDMKKLAVRGSLGSPWNDFSFVEKERFTE